MHAVNAAVIIEYATVKDLLDTLPELNSHLFLVHALVNLAENLDKDLSGDRGVRLD